jgi:HK97 family phage portal protein
VPAREIIHDKMDALHHHLVGISPLAACWQAIIQALRIQSSSSNFFENGANPGGVLTAPGFIAKDTAERLKEDWETKFSGDNAGRVAVLGDGLHFEPMRQTAVEAQLIEQLRWAAEAVCTVFHVPPFKIGVGPYPPYASIEAIEIGYYSQALQGPIEAIEEHLDKGLEMPLDVGVECDLNQLLRMDTTAKVTAARDAIGSAAVTIDEARQKWFGLGPVKGGDTPYMQQQNYSLAALAERDKNDPFAKPAPPAPAAPSSADTPPEDQANVAQDAGDLMTKALEELAAA